MNSFKFYFNSRWPPTPDLGPLQDTHLKLQRQIETCLHGVIVREERREDARVGCRSKPRGIIELHGDSTSGNFMELAPQT